MSRLVFTPRAKSDIAEIWLYSVEKWGEGQAEAYLRQIEKIAVAVAEDPKLGRACDDVRAGYRKFRVGSHILFYRWDDTRTEIVRILHQRMDPERHI